MVKVEQYGFKVEARAPGPDMSHKDIMIIAKDKEDFDNLGMEFERHMGVVRGREITTHYDFDDSCGWMLTSQTFNHKANKPCVAGFFNIGFNTFEEDLEEVRAKELMPTSKIRVAMETGHQICDGGFKGRCTEANAPNFSIDGIVKVCEVGLWLKKHYPKFEEAMLKHQRFHDAMRTRA